MRSSLLLKLALIFPVLGIAALIWNSEHSQQTGSRLRVPIEGYDPRDILRGHYLQYRFKWNFDLQKTREFARKFKGVYYGQSGSDRLCMNEILIVYPLAHEDSEKECLHLIKGNLVINDPIGTFEFLLGIERFYVPEQYARRLESMLRDSRPEVEFALNSQGRAVMVELYMHGRPWSEMIKR